MGTVISTTYDPSTAFIQSKVDVVNRERVNLTRANRCQPTITSARRPCVILDIDETLVSSTFFYPSDMTNLPDNFFQSIGVKYALVVLSTGQSAVVFVRPGLAKFIEGVSQLADLCVCTLGAKEYAMAVLDLIDPMGIYFGDRIVTKDDLRASSQLPAKTPLKKRFDLPVLVGREFFVVDDNPDAWDPTFVSRYQILSISQWNVFPHHHTRGCVAVGDGGDAHPVCSHAWDQDKFSSLHNDDSLDRVYGKINRAIQFMTVTRPPTNLPITAEQAILFNMYPIVKSINLCIPTKVRMARLLPSTGCPIIDNRTSAWWDCLIAEATRIGIIITPNIIPTTTHCVVLTGLQITLPTQVKPVPPAWVMLILESGLY